MSNIKSTNYWEKIDSQLDKFLSDGYLKLPPLSDLIDSEKYIDKIIFEGDKKNYSEASVSHLDFLNEIGLVDILSPILYKIACEKLGYKGVISNQYHIARYVEPGDIGEQYKTHFDSHLFTIVFPLCIPKSINGAGELLFKPNARRDFNSEFLNILQKIYYKRYANKDAVEKMVEKNEMQIESFSDCAPLIFLGRTTLHTNRFVSIDANHERLTLLAHFFDSSPKYGIGSVLRKLRKR